LISGVQNGVGIQGGSHFMLTRSDLTDYVSAIGSAETIALGALICNWWGSAAGPVPVDPVIPEGVYAPFAVAPIAGTGMICP
jgi:hypothetical protein